MITENDVLEFQKKWGKGIISIGNTTTDHIKDRGYEPLMTAKMQSYEGISNSIIDYLNEKLNNELS